MHCDRNEYRIVTEQSTEKDKPMANEWFERIVSHIFSLADEDGGFSPSPQVGYLGVADSKVSDLAATVYAAEIAQTLGRDVAIPPSHR